MNAPRLMAGNKEMTLEIVKTDGTITMAEIEGYHIGSEEMGVGINTQGIGTKMFMVTVAGRTNYKLYPTIRKAINAGAKF